MCVASVGPHEQKGSKRINYNDLRAVAFENIVTVTSPNLELPSEQITSPENQQFMAG